MYGWINACVEQLVLDKFGDAAWNKIKQDANIPLDKKWYKHEYYPDDETMALVGAAASALGVTAGDVLKLFGGYFLSYVSRGQYEKLLRCLGSNLRDWLSNVNRLHDHLTTALPHMIAPEFWTTNKNEKSFYLYYKSKRGGGLEMIVEGVVEEAAKKYFNVKVDLVLQATQDVDGAEHTIWLVNNNGDLEGSVDESLQKDGDVSVHSAYSKSHSTSGSCPFSPPINVPENENHTSRPIARIAKAAEDKERKETKDATATRQTTIIEGGLTDGEKFDYQLSYQQLGLLFPFHVVLRGNEIVQAGHRLRDSLNRNIIGLDVNAVFDVRSSADHARFQWNSDILKEVQNCHGLICFSLVIAVKQDMMKESREPITLRGTLTISPRSVQEFGFVETTSGAAYESFYERDCIMYLICHATSTSFEEMEKKGLSLNDFPRHLDTIDVILYNEHLQSEHAYGLKLEQMSDQLEKEREQSLAMKRTFVRYTSHEIRTPLMIAQMSLPLIVNSQCVKNGIGADKQAVLEAAQDCASSLDIAVRTLSNLLDYEKLDGGIMQLHNQRFIPVVDMILSCLHVYKSQSVSKDITVNIVNECFTAADAKSSELVEETSKMMSLDNKAKGLAAKAFSSLDRALRSNNNVAEPTSISLANIAQAKKSPLQQDVFVHVDTHKIDQVIRNLMSNAIKFTPNGGTVTVKMTVSEEIPSIFINSVTSPSGEGKTDSLKQVFHTPHDGFVPHGYFILEVRDTGPGIDSNDQTRLFREIIQFSPNELQGGGGSGLGLWISREIMRLHQGNVAVFSEGAGKGSSFYFLLPLYSQSNIQCTHVVASSPHANSNSISFNHNGRAVNIAFATTSSTPTNRQRAGSLTCGVPKNFVFLVVDDSAIIRKLLTKSLEAAGFKCDSAEDGLIAIQKVKTAIENSVNNHMAADHIEEEVGEDGAKVGSCAAVVAAASNKESPVTGSGMQYSQSEAALSKKSSAAATTTTTSATPSQNLPNDVALSPLLISTSSAMETKKSSKVRLAYDVILLDMVMPICDGVTACRAIRALGYDQPIIGVTGNARESDKEEFIAAGVDAVLTKPIKIEEVFLCLSKIL